MYRLLVLTALAQLLLQHALLVIANPVDAALPFEARRPLLPPMDSEDDRPFRPSEGFQKAPRKRSLAGPIPGGVRKMSGDEGEKFYMEYWQFGFQEEGAQQPMMLGSEQQKNDDDEDKDLHARTEHLRSRSMDDQQQEQELQQSETTAINGSMSFPPQAFHPPFLLHTDEQEVPLGRLHSKRDLSYLLSPRAWKSHLHKRAFQCPAGTNDCSSIGRPTSCCAQGETCQLVPDSGLGDVGCCSARQGCSGPVRNCEAGYTSCPGDIGGGCCIPNYVCVSMGCTLISHYLHPYADNS